jgi:hypothetical protein
LATSTQADLAAGAERAGWDAYFVWITSGWPDVDDIIDPDRDDRHRPGDWIAS